MKGVWRKACSCQGPSTSGRVVLTHRFDDEKLALFVKLTLHPGLVCDVCDALWTFEPAPVEAVA